MNDQTGKLASTFDESFTLFLSISNDAWRSMDLTRVLKSPLTASQKVHLRRCASSCVIAAYFYVRLVPQDSRALHLELFTVPSSSVTFTKSSHYEVITLDT
jgi:hypothetical protein